MNRIYRTKYYSLLNLANMLCDIFTLSLSLSLSNSLPPINLPSALPICRLNTHPGLQILLHQRSIEYAGSCARLHELILRGHFRRPRQEGLVREEGSRQRREEAAGDEEKVPEELADFKLQSL